jgi:hypothetical protein
VLPAGDFDRPENVHEMVETAVVTMKREMESWGISVNLKNERGGYVPAIDAGNRRHVPELSDQEQRESDGAVHERCRTTII